MLRQIALSQSSVSVFLLSLSVYIGFRMSRSSGNKTLDIEKIYIPAGAKAQRRWGWEAPAQTSPAKCFLSFGLVSEPEAEDCTRERKNGCLRLNYCGDFEKR